MVSDNPGRKTCAESGALDYGESHYIGPIKVHSPFIHLNKIITNSSCLQGAQPNSHAWVDGYPHTAWLHLNRYFAVAFKTGQYPAITKDQIFLWARPHPKDATSADRVPRPNNWQLVCSLHF